MPAECTGAANKATKDTVASTGLPGCYVRPIAYFGYGGRYRSRDGTACSDRHIGRNKQPPYP